ncbi:DNA internalization-related competence protein ComEC/Rec2 [Paenibacillus hamazuiensis]|uniref:DNA internalization-related competence protein ComEC/Rec2 n=1 Tax=Paenibacillus hamazuiensis TaxID=2936508 RepID=UPI00200D24A9|nr:DNA internalization-related competence protein ComEC/Rec2 [Paenibacillus hamazuiensis]
MSTRPVVAVCIFWIAGYVLAWRCPLPLLTLYASLLCGIAIIVVWTMRVPGKWWICGLLLMGAGAGYFGEAEHRNVSHVPLQLAEQEVRLHGTVASVVEVDGDKASLIVKGNLFAGSEAEAAETAGRGDEPAERFQINVRLLEQSEQSVAAGWRRGDRIELAGTLRLPQEARNFGGFDYREYLHRQHIHWLIQVKGASQAAVSPPERIGLVHVLRWNDQFRGFLGEAVERVFPAEQAGFMKGMLIGMTDDMDPEQFRQFSRLGLTHILAISGLNVAIFVGCVMWILGRFGLTQETRLLTCIALLPLYIAMTGASPSIVRAGLMGMIALYAAYRHILKDGLHSVMLVGLIMLLWEPYYLFDVSFQLSFLVTIGLIVGVPAMNRLMPIRQTMLRDALSITVMSQLIAFPVSIYYFNQLSLLSLLANLCLVPVFSLAVMPAGTVAMIAGIAWPWAGGWLGRMLAVLNDMIFRCVEWLGHWDWAQTLWPTPSVMWMALYYASLALLMKSLLERLSESAQYLPPYLGVQSRSRGGKLVPLVASAVLAALLWHGYDPQRWARDGEVDFLDVGQGDSILVRTPESGARLLIDGGGTLVFRKPGEEWKERKDPFEVGRKLVVPLLKQRGVHRLDYVILTHEDADHCGGLQAVLEEIPVSALLFNGTLKPSPAVEKLFRTALDKGVKLIAVRAGQKLEIDAKTALHVLYPYGGEQPIVLEKEQNNRSVVFRMEMDGTNWLFTGDMEATAESEVLSSVSEAAEGKRVRETGSKSGGDGGEVGAGRTEIGAADFPGGVDSSSGAFTAIDVLKVAHHGSKTSTTADWLDAWKPKHAVISVGQRNTYGHPHPTVLGRLEERKVGVLRTDVQGEVQMKVRDGDVHVRTKFPR